MIENFCMRFNTAVELKICISWFRVFLRRLTNGGFLAKGYCLRTIGYCFPYCFLELFVGGQGLDGRGQSRDGGIPQSPPTRETLWLAYRLNLFKQLFKQMIGYIDWLKLKHCFSTKSPLHGPVFVAKVFSKSVLLCIQAFFKIYIDLLISSPGCSKSDLPRFNIELIMGKVDIKSYFCPAKF